MERAIVCLFLVRHYLTTVTPMCYLGDHTGTPLPFFILGKKKDSVGSRLPYRIF